MNTKTELLTGIRPTGSLTIANYLGAVKPLVELQEEGESPLVFVADLHALTDNEPDFVSENVEKVVADYIALGLDPEQSTIYRQSDIEGLVTTMTAFLSRHVTISQLLRLPTLKDKVGKDTRTETANALLVLYPVLMAADILLNKAEKVPVGEDQVPHMEMARKLARRFNKRYKEIFPVPDVHQVESLRIKSLQGDGKMSKSNPKGALFLTDDMKTVEKKIKSAVTAFEGEMSDELESHILVAKELAETKEERQKIDSIIEEHMNGERVMGDFKQAFTDIVQKFLKKFQSRRAEIIQDENFLPSVLREGKKVAEKNARSTLKEAKSVMHFE
ncbi:MAG: tryptophan--tRNA ligase [Candidatus Magasanikbacteria bacterium]